MKKLIEVAHSPDADDIFMYMAIKFGWVGSSFLEFSSKSDDIESLNLATLKGEYDVSAISFALYPYIKNDYALLNTAVSFGEGYGPKLIRKKEHQLKPNFKVALSGEHTTNALLFRAYYPKARVVYMNFLDIQEAVLSGKVDAGVLIHESILDFDSSLCVEKELWDIWCELGGDGLPLPLGGMAIRRSIPLTDAIEAQRVLSKAVEVATKHKKLLSQMLLSRGLVRVDEIKLDKYLDLYANKESITLSDIQLQALNRLYKIGFDAKFYDQPIDINNYLIPTEYEKIRFS